MIFFVERRAAKIDEADVCVPQYLSSPPIGALRDCKPVVFGVDEQDVLGLQIGMDEVESMQERYALDQRLGKAPDMGGRERAERILFKKVKDRLAEKFRYDADMVAIGEGVEEVNTFARRAKVIRGSVQELLRSESGSFETYFSLWGSLLLSVLKTRISI